MAPPLLAYPFSPLAPSPTAEAAADCGISIMPVMSVSGHPCGLHKMPVYVDSLTLAVGITVVKVVSAQGRHEPFEHGASHRLLPQSRTIIQVCTG